MRFSRKYVSAFCRCDSSMYSGGFSEPAEYATGRQGAETAWKREGQREIQGGNVTERISDLHHIVISSTFFFFALSCLLFSEPGAPYAISSVHQVLLQLLY